MEKKKSIIIAVSILLMLMAVLATTFAYFQVAITGNNEASSIIIKTASLGIVYSEGNTLDVSDITPGWTASKSFTVTNSSTVETKYNIVWTEITNTFVNKSNLVYTLTGTNSKSETQCPSINGSILDNITLAKEATHSYTITLTYQNTSNNQADDMQKEFSGMIQITQGS